LQFGIHGVTFVGSWKLVFRDATRQKRVDQRPTPDGCTDGNEVGTLPGNPEKVNPVLPLSIDQFGDAPRNVCKKQLPKAFASPKRAFPTHGAVAQLGERRVRNAKVEGSIPFRSTISLPPSFRQPRIDGFFLSVFRFTPPAICFNDSFSTFSPRETYA